jgi:hypothetical protein
MSNSVYMKGFGLGPDGKAHPFSGTLSWTDFKTGFQILLEKTAGMPERVKQSLAPSSVIIKKPKNELINYKLIVTKMPHEQFYILDSVFESTNPNGPAPMLQRTTTYGIDDLVTAIESKLDNAGFSMSGGKKRKRSISRRRKTRKVRRT